MSFPRDELTRRLSALKTAMPAMMREYPAPEDFNLALMKLIHEISSNASVEDREWAIEEIDDILERHGLWWPTQDNLPPEDS